VERDDYVDGRSHSQDANSGIPRHQRPLPEEVASRHVHKPAWIVRTIARVRGEQSIPDLLARGLNSNGNFYAARYTEIDAQCAWAITIGDRVTFAGDVRVIAHDAATKRLTGYTVVRPVSIGDRTYVGAGAIILPGVTIGADCVIGAGAIVTRDVPEGSVAVGNPARVVGSAAELRERHQRLMAETARIDVAPAVATPGQRLELQAALREYGSVYVP
jgi:maltose O-acetyltransferase